MKKNKSKFIIPLISLLLIGCSGKQNQISVFIYDENDTFLKELVSYLKADLTRESIEYSLNYAKRSQAVQNNQITKEIESKENRLLLINTVDRLSDSTIIEKATLYNLPIIFFNREPLDRDLNGHSNCYYVGSNPKTEGLLQAELAANLFSDPKSLNPKYDKNGDGQIQIVLLKGEQGHQDMENRSKYCIDGLKDKGYNLDILTTTYCNWNRLEGYDAMSTIYPLYGSEMELLFSNNDDMALGAIDYFLEKEIFIKDAADVSEQPFPIIGVDATIYGQEAIKDHYLYATIKNDSLTQADAVTTLASYLINNKEIPTDGTFPYPFTSTNKIYIEGKALTLSDIL